MTAPADTASESELRRRRLGTGEAEPATRRLRAGPLTAELIEGNLRNIRVAGVEVLRAISYVVRDKDWGTYAPLIEGLAIDETAEGFRLAYRARCTGTGGERLAYEAVIIGRADASLSFEVEAIPKTDFLTNRCGFTVLHPIVGIAGGPVVVEHVDGTVETSVLPDLIDPWQPFREMRAISHEVSPERLPGVVATCRMEGDSFEMEDQRNWSDASYKTYVRPLALPWPYVLPAGEHMRQAVTLTLRGTLPPFAEPMGEPEPVRLELGGAFGRRAPKIGLVVTPEESEATIAAGHRLAELAPQTLLFHFDPTTGHGRTALEGFARVAALLPQAERVLECVVPGVEAPADELAAIAAEVEASGLRLDAVAVSPDVDRRSTPPGSAWPDCPPLEEVYDAARAAFPGLRLGGGMFSYFTELNRKPVPAALLDFVSHCTCPIVHDADDRSVMQSLEALPFILRSTRAMIGEAKPYRIGPSTIGMRQNPYGSRTMANPERRRMTMTPEDPRQDGLFAAAYMVGYSTRLAAAGVESFIVGGLTGPLGLTTHPTAPTGLRPAFASAHILARLNGFEWHDCHSSDEARVLAIAASQDNRRRVLAVNITGEQQVVEVPLSGTALLLDEACFAEDAGVQREECAIGADRRIVLNPYAVIEIRE
ncbi:hypothetical protein MWN34_04210 [Ancylobacter sp. 6x-1]|uniref:Uncharacterized protein n=1 Tax=Ancylobacter crimeensis TaxID=2579147 RepID=A0ABT0D8J7_9HYPH|nr:hypothetical protein [Ancylobacter crimeensis]MCK0196112.1 hypothetical protein [Ancylobacter crimeensis]